MKHIVYIVSTIIIGTIMSSCQDVIDVDLPIGTPRLVVDAIIRVDTTKVTTDIRILVKETSTFFEENTPANPNQISMDRIDVPLPNGEVFLLEDIDGSGVFGGSIPTKDLMEGRWSLTIEYNDQIFIAETQYVPTVPIENIEFGDGILFNEDDIEVIISFIDPPNTDDFYLFDLDFENFLVTDDEFYQGQPFSFSFFYDAGQLNQGNEIEISILGIDEPFSDFIEKVFDQSDGDFNPFDTPAITIRGNIINSTAVENGSTINNLDDFALGYFALVQEFKETIVVE